VKILDLAEGFQLNGSVITKPSNVTSNVAVAMSDCDCSGDCQGTDCSDCGGGDCSDCDCTSDWQD